MFFQIDLRAEFLSAPTFVHLSVLDCFLVHLNYVHHFHMILDVAKAPEFLPAESAFIFLLAVNSFEVFVPAPVSVVFIAFFAMIHQFSFVYSSFIVWTFY